MEALNPWRMRVMGAPRKYSDELRERATRMAVEARRDPASRAGAIKRVADQLGMHPETLRNWVRQAEVDAGVRSGTTTDDAERLAKMEREVRELKRRTRFCGRRQLLSRQRSSTAN
jgi:transposase